MTTLFDYLSWRGDLPLSADPFHEVDGVILARFTYMPFHRVLQRDSLTPTTVEAVCRALLALPDIETAVRRRGDTDLLRALVESPRYKGMELTAYADRLDAESQTQFSAITVKLEEGHYCVAYRGTDNTLIGWKEDFNMGFVCPVPGQKLAVDYLQKAARRLPGRLTVCGHSKGGNFAVYAAAFCGEEIQDRIEAVYNYDGPGFDSKVLSEPGYQRICKKIQTFVPQSSVVGMLLGHEEKYTIVHSNKTGLTQHDIYSWEVGRDSFLHLDTVTSSSRFVDKTLKNWMGEMTPAQRESFTDAIFTVIDGADVSTLHELGDNWFQSTKGMLKSIKGLDEPTRKAVTHTLMLLAKSTGSGLFRMLRQTG